MSLPESTIYVNYIYVYFFCKGFLPLLLASLYTFMTNGKSVNHSVSKIKMSKHNLSVLVSLLLGLKLYRYISMLFAGILFPSDCLRCHLVDECCPVTGDTSQHWETRTQGAGQHGGAPHIPCESPTRPRLPGLPFNHCFLPGSYEFQVFRHEDVLHNTYFCSCVNLFLNCELRYYELSITVESLETLSAQCLGLVPGTYKLSPRQIV